MTSIVELACSSSLRYGSSDCDAEALPTLFVSSRIWPCLGIVSTRSDNLNLAITALRSLSNRLTFYPLLELHHLESATMQIAKHRPSSSGSLTMASARQTCSPLTSCSS